MGTFCEDILRGIEELIFECRDIRNDGTLCFYVEPTLGVVGDMTIRLERRPLR